MSAQNHNQIPETVSASLKARLAPFPGVSRASLEGLDVAAAPAVSPGQAAPHRSLVQDLKLLFAALGAGNSVVPMGDNGRTTRLLSEYAASLRDH